MNDESTLYEQGRAAARDYQQSSDPGHLINGTAEERAEWQQELLRLTVCGT